MNDRMRARVALGEALRAHGYEFVTVTPATHARVLARAAQQARPGPVRGTTLRDVFGWSKPFELESLPPDVRELALRAEVLESTRDGAHRATVRFSTLSANLFLHSAYPTDDEDAVFFGPDTYRFHALLEADLPARVDRLVDVGCGSGAGAIAVAGRARSVVLAEVSERALEAAAVNARLANVGHAELVKSDVLASVAGPFDAVIANPPYMADAGARTYRDGGGTFGEELAVRITRESLGRLSPGGTLVLYTGAAIVEGRNTLAGLLAAECRRAGAEHRFRELDPDVFGEEIAANEAYASVDRIAAVALVATLPTRRPGR